MLLWLAGAALFLILFYFYVNREKRGTIPISEKPKLEKPKLEKFIASNTFAGPKPGYVFKKDNLGIGYYLDYK